MRIVVAPDSFKGSATAIEVARAIAEGWSSVRDADDLVLLPQADGGEGTLDAVESAVPGAVRRSAGTVSGPDGRPTPGVWLDLPHGIALVELAAVSGLPLMHAPDALAASTRGLGETIAAALDAGAAELWLALGGSASTDGGAGALSALGLRLLDAEGRDLPDGAPIGLAELDRSRLREHPRRVRLLTDVTSPLLGATGAAAVFGPQKGATPHQVVELDAALARFAALLGPGSGNPGAGAAGGTAYGFIAAWGADVESGADAVARLTGLDEALASADLVVTGEGRFDATSHEGKVVGRVLRSASAPVLVIAGQLGVPVERAVALDELAGSAREAMERPLHWLRVAGAAAASAVS